MNKTLIFLYPIKEYIRMIDLDQATFDKFVRTLNLRYRSKGYNIFFVMYPDKEIGIPIDSSDSIILTDINFSEHITKNGNGEYPYPNPNLIIEQLPKSDEYVVCGFHAADCVEKVANHFYKKVKKCLVKINNDSNAKLI